MFISGILLGKDRHSVRILIMPRRQNSTSQKRIEQYEHKDKDRLNNPPVGLVDSHTDNGGQKKKTYEYDPHLDPQLQWAGKAEHTSFEVPTVSLHVHERIDPRRIIESVRKKEEESDEPSQPSLFEEKRLPRREAIEFYKHRENWSNRLIAGDSLLVMNSLLEKEGMGGKVQMVYFDPPYGIKYGSNFQPFVNKRDIREDKDENLTAEPEMIKAFRDTWELGIHSYLTYLRDRLLLARELLSETGSAFVQIGDENVHRVSLILDEVFGAENRVATITFATTSGSSANTLPQVADYILWYAKDKIQSDYYRLYEELSRKEIIEFFSSYVMVELPDGSTRQPTAMERFDPDKNLPKGSRIYRRTGLDSQGHSTTGRSEPYEWNGKSFHCSVGRQWSVSKEAMDQIADLGRLDSAEGASLMWRKYEDEVPGRRINNIWPSQMYESNKTYVVQTASTPIQRCMLMTTEPGELVLDITCGSGTTAQVAEQLGRRWITCDTSRVALTLAKKRMMTVQFDYYKFAQESEGVSSGFAYKTVAKVTPRILGEGAPPEIVHLRDQPRNDSSKIRVTGPFTVEAVPAPYAKSTDENSAESGQEADNSVARSGETLRQGEWIDRLKDGVRGKGGETISFSRIETLEATRHFQAHGETLGEVPKRVLVCFGPEHAPLEQRLVELALDEAEHMRPAPQMILFCAFQFDPEARKDIEETNWKDVQLLEVQMDADLSMDDLKKKPRDKNNPAFWLIGQPDVEPKKLPDGMYQVEVKGFDYYNPKTGQVESGGTGDIAMWMLDPDYDDRSLFPTQVFFPMAGDKEGWAKLAKNLKAEIDEEKIEAFRGTVSLPFKAGRKVAVKIIDSRGIESLKIIHL